MIKVILGNKGKGKTLTAVKEILKNDRKCFVNFEVKHKKAIRLKTEHIVKVNNEGKTKTKKVNWEFWNQEIKKGVLFDIYIDEAHNVLNSRRSLSSWNTLITMWLTQIRKVLGESETAHLYLITQRLNSIDIVARDLQDVIIVCDKIIMIEDGIKHVWIMKYYFFEPYSRQKLDMFLLDAQDTYDGQSYFYANPIFKYYNSYELVTFGDEVYL